MKRELVISEKFYSIQGEGQTMGKPSIFLRLAGCNLLCKSKYWICDSIEVWQKGTPVKFKDVFTPEELGKLQDQTTHLIITGGEPMLYQKKLLLFFDWFVSEYDFLPIIEIETNGTILPINDFANIVSYWNCSPKLSNSGEPRNKRIKEDVIKFINSRPNSIFKFVIKEQEDVLEMIKEYGRIIDFESVVLMPAGEEQKELEKTRLMVVNQCLSLGFRYCDRLHIVIWNQKTGV